MTKPQKTHFADDATLERLTRLEAVYETAVAVLNAKPPAYEGVESTSEWWDFEYAVSRVQTGLDSNEN